MPKFYLTNRLFKMSGVCFSTRGLGQRKLRTYLFGDYCFISRYSVLPEFLTRTTTQHTSVMHTDFVTRSWSAVYLHNDCLIMITDSLECNVQLSNVLRRQIQLVEFFKWSSHILASPAQSAGALFRWKRKLLPSK